MPEGILGGISNWADLLARGRCQSPSLRFILSMKTVDSSMRPVALKSKEGMMSHPSPESTQSVKAMDGLS